MPKADTGGEGCSDGLGKSLVELVAEADSDRLALVSPEQGMSLTYHELLEVTERLAGNVSALGVERGDRVALVVGDGPQFILLFLALAAMGVTAMPLNPGYTEKEYGFYFSDLMPTMLLAGRGTTASVRAAASISVTNVLDPPKGELVPRLALRDRSIESTKRFDPAQASDVVLLLHTSGTTSRPKQVPLQHANVAASAGTIGAHYELTASDVSYCVMPLFHVHGLVASVFASFATGGTVIAPRRFSPRALWTHLAPYGVTWLSASPTLHQMILERRGTNKPPATLRFLRSCSAALSPRLMETVETTLEASMLEAYGMTEASHQISSNPLPPAPRVAGTVGRPTGTSVRIVDSAGKDVPAGSLGEVVIRGPGVTSGYLNDPEATADAFTDGWFRTGDQARLEKGYIKLEGRLKEMILRGGENISPYEIEDVLQDHAAVRYAACFGVQDDKYGERVLAAVELAGPASERELLRHCRENLAAFKVPDRVHVVTSLPRTATGKVQRNRIATLIAGD